MPSKATLARAEEHRDTITIGRTHGVHAEPTTFGLKLLGWVVPARARSGAARTRARGNASREAVGRSRHLRYDHSRGGADRVRGARAGARAELDADPPARPARRAPVHARDPRVVPRPLRARDPASRAYGGAGGRGAVRVGAEGLVGDAAQAQPDRRRAHLRARAPRARIRVSRARERGALARAGHLALVGRARRHSRRLPRRRTTCSAGSRGSWRGWSCGRSACGRTSRRPAGSSSASGSCSRSSSRASSATRRTARCSATRCGHGTKGSTSASLARSDPQIASRVGLDGVFDLHAYTEHVDAVFARVPARLLPEEVGA